MQLVRQVVMEFMEETVWQVTLYWNHLYLPRHDERHHRTSIKSRDSRSRLSQYKNEEQREKENEQLVLDEIKRKDRSFYDQWCNDEN